MDLITNLLYWISTGMLVPVVVFLLFFFVRSLLMIGSFYGTYIGRTKINAILNKRAEEEDPETFLASLPESGEGDNRLVRYLNRIKEAPRIAAFHHKILGDYEVEADKQLDKSRTLVKIGPMLGLMGTLIPMGPALVGLATGDISSMATNMQVAFATTVVGIIIGAVGFITLQVRQRWAAGDMNLLEFITDSLQATPEIPSREAKTEAKANCAGQKKFVIKTDPTARAETVQS